MGSFSFITQDTDESIIVCSANPKTIYMFDNKGNRWTETDYEGYGVFGGKDFYQLLAEMNEAEGLTGDVDIDREIGISIHYGDNRDFIAPNLVESSRWTWINEIPEDCPRQGAEPFDFFIAYHDDDDDDDYYDDDDYDYFQD